MYGKYSFMVFSVFGKKNRIGYIVSFMVFSVFGKNESYRLHYQFYGV